MSFGTFWGTDPNDQATYQKILGKYLEGGAAGQQDLNEVLAVGNSAQNQSATDFNVLGAVSVETGLVEQGNNAALAIGAVGDNLQILGATALGTLLVGDGVNTQSLPLGANGLVLTASPASALGVEWAIGGGGGGGVASVVAGTNINIGGTAANPVVNVVNPIVLANGTDTTSYSQLGITKSVGATTLGITSTTGSIDLTPIAAGDVNVNVSGAGRVHITQGGTGGDTQPAISVENNNGNANGVHIDVYKNSASPAAADNLGTLSFHGNSSTGAKTEYAEINAVINDPTNASQNGSMSLLACVNSATPVEFFRVNGANGTNQLYRPLDANGNAIQTTTNTLTLSQPNAAGALNILSQGANNSITIQATTGSSSISVLASNSLALQGSTQITMTAGAANGIIISQPTDQRTQLRTNISSPPYTPTYPIDFYPKVAVENNNVGTVLVDRPRVPYQELDCINFGITPIVGWDDEGTAFGNANSMWYDGAFVWMDIGGGQVIITDTAFGTIYQTIQLGTTGATLKANVFFEYSGHTYIGGSFESVNGNATQQYGLTRFNTASAGNFPYVEDPMFDSVNAIYGINSSQEIYAIAEFGSYLYVGGNFTNFDNGSVASYSFRVANPTGTGGSQTYETNFSALDCNNTVDALVAVGGYIWYGGQFTTTQNGFFPAAYIAAYDGVNWTQVAGNVFNNPVFSMGVSQTVGNYILVGGSFNQNSTNGLCYIDYTTPSAPETLTNIGASLSVNRNSIYNDGGVDCVVNNDSVVYNTTGAFTWVNKGASNSGYNPSGIFFIQTTPLTIYVSFSNYNFVRATFVQNQAVQFVGNNPNTFFYDGNAYTTFVLSNRYTAMKFVANSTSLYWVPCGALPIGASWIV